MFVIKSCRVGPSVKEANRGVSEFPTIMAAQLRTEYYVNAEETNALKWIVIE